MRPKTFEFRKKYGISQITIFREVKENNIDSESFLKFDSAHFGILIGKKNMSEKCWKKNFLKDQKIKKNFFF